MRNRTLPALVAGLILTSATLAYGQATTVATPGGQIPPVATPTPVPNTGPGPTPTNATVAAPGGQVPPAATPTPALSPAPGPSRQGTTSH